MDLFTVKIKSTDKLYLFTEECNGDGRTDYASALKEVIFSTKDATNAYDAESLVPLTTTNKLKGTVAIGKIKSNAKTIVLTGAAVCRTSTDKVTKVVRAIKTGAFKNSHIDKIVIKDMTSCQSQKLVHKIRLAGYKGIITAS